MKKLLLAFLVFFPSTSYEVDVPSGWYVKLENSGSGTHSESVISGQKTIYN